MIALGVYRIATRLGGPLFDAALRLRARRAKEDPDRLPERLGHPSLPRPPGRLLWLHGASVGEALAVLPLLETLLAGRAELEALVTTGTVSSARLMAERLPARARHQFAPVDRPDAWRRFLGHWRPDLLLLVESELWPNLILESRRQGVAMALVNARMSARSAHRWRRARGMAAALLRGFELCLAQSGQDRDRLQALGAAPVRAIGNLKGAAPALPAAAGALAELRDVVGARPVWLAASTHPDEEPLLLEVHHRLAACLPGVLTIVAPRHPERGIGLADWLRRQGVGIARRALGELPGPDCALYVADTLGELGLFYRLAPVAFIGKSLVAPGGGQNPLEAARLGCPVLFGPAMANFAEPAARLVQAGGARQVGGALELATAAEHLLRDPAARAAMAERARAAAAAEAGALGAALAALAPLLERCLGPADAST